MCVHVVRAFSDKIGLIRLFVMKLCAAAAFGDAQTKEEIKKKKMSSENFSQNNLLAKCQLKMITVGGGAAKCRQKSRRWARWE